MKINYARASKRVVESGAVRTLTALHLLRFTNVPTFAFRTSANSCCCCYPRGCAPSTPLENAAFLHPISVSSRGQVHDVPVCDVYRLALAKTANIEPARLSRINTRRPRHSETLSLPPPLPPHPPCITTASTSAFTSAASHHPFASSFMLPTAPTSFIRTDTTTTPRRHAGSRLFRDFLADSRADRASPLHRSSCIAYRPYLPPSLSPLLHPPLIHPWRIYHGRIEIGRYVRPFDVRAFHAKQMVQHRGRTIFDPR